MRDWTPCSESEHETLGQLRAPSGNALFAAEAYRRIR